MTLEILVNHYKEDEKTVERFLSSLAMQRGVEFRVMLCSDGGVRLRPEVFERLPFEITYQYLPHTGVCHTRNVMMDRATADYLMFCDVDDCFSSPYGLSSLMSAAEKSHADVIGSPYQCERFINGEYEYVTYKNDTIRVHGKIFRRAYLTENHIRFPDELETSGDMSFLWLTYALTDRIVWVPENFYIWKWNPDSVTRADPYSHVMAYDRTLRCYELLAKDLVRRKREDLFRNLVTTTVSMIYVDMTHPKWGQAPEEYQERARKAVCGYLSEYYDFYASVDENYRKSKYLLMLNYKHFQGFSGAFEGIDEWAHSLIPAADQPKGNGEENREEGSVLIIGYGVVGSNLARELERLNPEIYDKYKEIDTRTADKYKVAFICVDTPATADSDCDTTEVKNAIMENEALIYVVKSTVLPGTTERLMRETGKHIIFSPEYYGGTQHCNNFSFPFTILGGEKRDCTVVIQLLQRVYDGRHQFRITDSKTAELVKYMENSFLAMKTSFCQQFFDIAEKAGVCYEELRELFILDPRVGSSHTFVYRDHPYWDSHCLNKDVPAIANAYEAELLLSLIAFNERRKTHESQIPVV